ncbi:AB hydrolase-1 domain-containing protein [Mycena kentingensis (nom. inval.)]|nr:AB hydrolase-1 domain-containing protein [Mycena kentingensis (nom. inval.)]
MMAERDKSTGAIIYPSWPGRSTNSSNSARAAKICPAFVGAASSAAENTFDWSQLSPSKNLTWVPCNGIFQCARLEVPLDYSTTDAGSAGIAIMRLPANVSGDDYRGPVLFNPGGPGGSGVEAMEVAAPLFSSVLGPAYDFVGFDPRGVGFSAPAASFFETAAESALWRAAQQPTSLNATSDGSAPARVWGLAQIQGQLAAKRDGEHGNIFKYMTTDNVARDMAVITIAMGFPKLQYYGISYGTVLGATYAALFPEKIERMVLDGVVDFEGWFKADLRLSASGTDAALDTFFTSCAAVGPSACAFAPSTNSTAHAVAARLSALTDAVRAKPVPAFTSAGAGYGLVDYSMLREMIFSTLYTPYAGFPLLAQALADLERGDGSALFSLGNPIPPFDCDSPGSNSTTPSTIDNVGAAGEAIRCGDAVEVHDTIAQLNAFYHSAAKVSQFAEFFVGRSRVLCSGWKIYREGRFDGPFGAKNTSFPILFVANTADPVTPKESALKTMAGFPGSALLVQDSPGHTSLTTTSLCTIGALKEYFTNGVLPPPGTVCAVQAKLFESSTASVIARQEELDLDVAAVAAAKKLAALISPLRGGPFM